MTLRDYFETRWSPTLPRRFPETTVNSYRSSFRRLLLPALGDRPLAEVTRRDVRTVVIALQANFADATIKAALGALGSLYLSAEADELVERSPVPGASRRLLRPAPPVDRAMPADEVQAFLATAKRMAASLYALFFVMAVTGLRVAEACGLQVGDVAAETGHLRVERQYRGRGQTRRPKGGRARRIDLADVALDLIRDRLTAPRTAWLFPAPHGGPFHPTYVTKRFRDVADAAGIAPERTSHALRHGVATALVEHHNGDVSYAQAVLGHSSPAQTKWYAKGAVISDRDAVNALAARTRLPARRVEPAERMGRVARNGTH